MDRMKEVSIVGWCVGCAVQGGLLRTCGWAGDIPGREGSVEITGIPGIL